MEINGMEYVDKFIKKDIEIGLIDNYDILINAQERLNENRKKADNKIFLNHIKNLRKKYGRQGAQNNFIKLKFVFQRLNSLGIISEHCLNYMQSVGRIENSNPISGLDICREIAEEKKELNEKIKGYCFYNLEDVEKLISGERNFLKLTFGSFGEYNVSNISIQKIIETELKKSDFKYKISGEKIKNIEIINFKWDCHIGSSEDRNYIKFKNKWIMQLTGGKIITDFSRQDIKDALISLNEWTEEYIEFEFSKENGKGYFIQITGAEDVFDISFCFADDEDMYYADEFEINSFEEVYKILNKFLNREIIEDKIKAYNPLKNEFTVISKTA